MSLGKLIRLYRRKHDVSLLALAEDLGISYSMLQRLEDSKNTYPPPPDLLEKISQVIQLPYVELLASLGYLSEAMKTELPSVVEAVSVISSVQFYQEAERPLSEIKTKDMVYTAAAHALPLLAIRIQETQWAPWILEGDVLIVERSTNLHSGDRVVLLDHTKKAFVIKRGHFLEKQLLLSDYPDGTAIEAYSPEGSLRLYGKIIEQHRQR